MSDLPTRFCPTLSGYAHVGGYWCALVNWAFGLDEGIILRYEDMTALHTVDDVTTPKMLAYAKDFKEQFERCGVPIFKETWQSAYNSECAEIAQRVFAGGLSWDITNWRSRCRHFGIPSANFAGESPLMAQLSRVVADHHDGVKHVIRGTELAAEKEAYWIVYHLVFPDTKPEDRPFLWFIPEVKQPDAQKISKSEMSSLRYMLRELDIDPVKMAVGLCRNQMTPTGASGLLQDHLRRDAEATMMGLRKFIKNATFIPDPQPITAEHLEEWR